MQLLSDQELLARLIGFDSVSRNSNLPLADFICDYLDGRGLTIRKQRSLDGSKANVIAHLGPEVDPETRSGLILSGHMDVVPADEQGWHSDPFELIERDDVLFGRGTADMKGFVALAINSAARLAGERLERPLVLVLTRDEEIGTLGARDLVERWPDRGALPRKAIIGEPTSLHAVRLHKGHLKLEVQLRGVSAHSGYPHLGKNAIELAGRAIAGLHQLRQQLQTERTATSEFFPDAPFAPLNIGTITGGSAVNVVADRCTIELGLRPLPGMDPSELVQRVRDGLAAVLSPDEHTVEERGESPALLLDEQAPVYRELSELLDQHRTHSVGYSTDAGWLQHLDMHCVVCGPGSIEVAHRPDEHISLAQLAKGRQLVDRAVAHFCGSAAPIERPADSDRARR